MSFQENRFYKYDITTVMRTLSKILVQDGYEIVDKNTRNKELVFKTKKSLFNRSQQTVKVIFTMQDPRVEVKMRVYDRDDTKKSRDAVIDIFTKLDEALPIITPKVS